MGVTAKQRIHPIAYERIPFGAPVSAETAFCNRLSDWIGGVRAIPVGRARSGLHLLARFAVESTGRRKVLMSPYTVPDVVNMVLMAGGLPHFLDHEPGATRIDLNYLEQALDEHTACVLITHYHVNEDRLIGLREMCRTVGAYLFDDCALAFGGTVDGDRIGGLTDASVFSFSSFKLLNFFWGGAVTTKDRALADWLNGAVSAWPRLRLSQYGRQARACVTYDFATRPAIFGTLVFPTLRKRARAAGAAQSLENVRIESTELDETLTSRPHPSAFAEWLRKLPKIDSLLARRRELARIYNDALGRFAVSGPIQEPELEGGCFVNYPLLTPAARRNQICLEMMSAGFDVGRSLYPNAHRMPQFSSLGGKTENVDRLAASAVYLPTHFDVTDSYARAISTALAERLA